MPVIPDGDFLLLVDASSFVHRAFHALPKITRRSDGMPTGAIQGLSWSLMKMFLFGYTAIKRRPTYGALVVDRRGNTFRHDLFPEYKANRDGYDPELEKQLPLIDQVAEAFSLPIIGEVGVEADDLIATLVTKAEKQGIPCVIASTDKDLMQLVSDNTVMYDSMKDFGGERETRSIIDVSGVVAKWGVLPWQMIDLQALTGDAVDNIPGAMGIGPKKAARLIKEFGDLDAILEAADWGPDEFRYESEYQKIAEALPLIPISRQLVTLDRHLDIDVEVDDLYLKSFDRDRLKAFMKSMEFASLYEKL